MRLGLAIACCSAACAHAPAPTVTGAELYAHVDTLRATGRATIGTVAVRKEDVLTTGGANGQAFLVEQVVATCRGGDPSTDVDCTLALLLDQRFIVTDHVQERPGPKSKRDDESSSIIASLVVVGLAVGAIGGLVYGAATCEFEGCKYVFGVPIVLVAGGSLFLLGRD